MSYMIRLKTATLFSQPRSGSTLSITAKVKNINPVKQVFVHYKSYPFWQDKQMNFSGHYSDYDVFELPTYTVYSNEFDLFCIQGPDSGWDNNDGRNYLLNTDQTVVGGNVVLNTASANVEYSRTGTTASVKGEIYVNNRNYTKIVGIVYSLNGNNQWNTCNATYKGPVLYFGAETWEFSIPAFTIDPNVANYLKFAVFYNNVDGNITYWDNNFNQDYKLPLLDNSVIN